MPRVAMIIFGLQALVTDLEISLAPSKMDCCVELMGGCRCRWGGGLNMNELMRWRREKQEEAAVGGGGVYDMEGYGYARMDRPRNLTSQKVRTRFTGLKHVEII